MQEENINIRKILQEVAIRSNGDYPFAFKLLGFLIYIAQEGNESLLSGEMISPRTYYRWVEKINQAGYGDLLADVRIRQVVSDFINQRYSDLPINEVKSKVLEAVEMSIDSIQT